MEEEKRMEGFKVYHRTKDIEWSFLSFLSLFFFFCFLCTLYFTIKMSSN